MSLLTTAQYSRPVPAHKRWLHHQPLASRIPAAREASYNHARWYVPQGNFVRLWTPRQAPGGYQVLFYMSRKLCDDRIHAGAIQEESALPHVTHALPPRLAPTTARTRWRESGERRRRMGIFKILGRNRRHKFRHTSAPSTTSRTCHGVTVRPHTVVE